MDFYDISIKNDTLTVNTSIFTIKNTGGELRLRSTSGLKIINDSGVLNEGAEIFLDGYGSFNGWSIDSLSDQFRIFNEDTKLSLVANRGGSVELYYNNAKVAETTANGISGAVWG